MASLVAEMDDQTNIIIQNSYWSYLIAELNSEDTSGIRDSKTERISNFLNVPLRLEKLMIVGYLVCLDSFLYIFTILPLRIIIAVFSLVKSMFSSFSLLIVVLTV
jgi:hypothetical protein